jgi:L-iditol 2-dehydrogenase
MNGLVFLGDRTLELRELPDPTPGPRDVILEIKASGMCANRRAHWAAVFANKDFVEGLAAADRSPVGPASLTRVRWRTGS